MTHEYNQIIDSSAFSSGKICGIIQNNFNSSFDETMHVTRPAFEAGEVDYLPFFFDCRNIEYQ